MSVNRPCGSSFARFSSQRPSTTAASGESIVTSMSEKLSVPIFARSEYFTRVPVADCFPTAFDFVFRDKHRRSRPRVAVHERVYVAAIPGVLLGAEDGLNFSD